MVCSAQVRRSAGVAALPRSGFVGAVFFVSPVEAGRRTWAFAGGAGLRAAYGFADFFQLGVLARFTTSQQLTFSSATVNGQPGNLIAAQYAVELALDARLIGDVHRFRGRSRAYIRCSERE